MSTVENEDLDVVDPNAEDEVAGGGDSNSMNRNMSTNEGKDMNCAETNTTLVELVTFAGENNITSQSESVNEVHDNIGLCYKPR